MHYMDFSFDERVRRKAKELEAVFYPYTHKCLNYAIVLIQQEINVYMEGFAKGQSATDERKKEKDKNLYQ